MIQSVIVKTYTVKNMAGMFAYAESFNQDIVAVILEKRQKN